MLLRSLVAVTVIVSCTVPVAAAEVRGVVRKVNLDKKELLLDGRGKGVRGQLVLVHFTDETRFEAGRQASGPAELAPGKNVRVQFEMRDGLQVATRVSWLALPSSVAPTAPAADANTLTGSLERIALTEREITVIGASEKGAAAVETTLPVADDVVVTRDQKPIAFDDLKEGEQAVVKFEQRGERRVAKTIAVGTVARIEPQRGEKVREVMKLIEGLLQQLRDRR